MKGICILSGGMDSTTVAYMMKRELGCDLKLLAFDYGQKHSVELNFACRTALILESELKIIDLKNLKPLFEGSSLIDENHEISDGHYAEENMRKTVVPNRNSIMLSIAWAYACSFNADYVGCGVHQGDHFIYPDCRNSFITTVEKAFLLGTEGHRKENLKLYTPLLSADKVFVVKKGIELGVDFKYTWTCYKGKDKHCGTCGSCNERKEAFLINGIKDPTEYEVV